MHSQEEDSGLYLNKLSQKAGVYLNAISNERTTSFEGDQAFKVFNSIQFGAEILKNIEKLVLSIFNNPNIRLPFTQKNPSEKIKISLNHKYSDGQFIHSAISVYMSDLNIDFTINSLSKKDGFKWQIDSARITQKYLVPLFENNNPNQEEQGLYLEALIEQMLKSIELQEYLTKFKAFIESQNFDSVGIDDDSQKPLNNALSNNLHYRMVFNVISYLYTLIDSIDERENSFDGHLNTITTLTLVLYNEIKNDKTLYINTIQAYLEVNGFNPTLAEDAPTRLLEIMTTCISIYKKQFDNAYKPNKPQFVNLSLAMASVEMRIIDYIKTGKAIREVTNFLENLPAVDDQQDLLPEYSENGSDPEDFLKKRFIEISAKGKIRITMSSDLFATDSAKNIASHDLSFDDKSNLRIFLKLLEDSENVDGIFSLDSLRKQPGVESENSPINFERLSEKYNYSFQLRGNRGYRAYLVDDSKISGGLILKEISMHKST
ncbi:MAG: hypothetical protein WCK98_01230 [bacterium]